MKRTPKLKKKTIRNLKLKLRKLNDRKAAPAYIMAPSNGSSC